MIFISLFLVSLFQAAQKGVVGMNIYSMWFYPLTESTEDIAATERVKDFMYGWYVMLYHISEVFTIARVKQILLPSHKNPDPPDSNLGLGFLWDLSIFKPRIGFFMGRRELVPSFGCKLVIPATTANSAVHALSFSFENIGS
jgi:hypothetical protein